MDLANRREAGRVQFSEGMRAAISRPRRSASGERGPSSLLPGDRLQQAEQVLRITF
ncbi:hypothetical protein [Streptomyces umbrinus]|uniref:hypothetical protein n=1 Tax=Streptomyces umbrinus TaxID=67370 RepID=UPI0034419B4E